jgi:hypothetical protein
VTATARCPAFVAHTPEFDEVIGEWPRPSGSTSRPTHTHDASVPHTLVLAPGLVIDKVYVGYWFFLVAMA